MDSPLPDDDHQAEVDLVNQLAGEVAADVAKARRRNGDQIIHDLAAHLDQFEARLNDKLSTIDERLAAIEARIDGGDA